MASIFQTVTVAVSAVGIALATTRTFRPSEALRDLGRLGTSWFDHDEDHMLDERPDDNFVDEPIPHRPLRGRND